VGALGLGARGEAVDAPENGILNRQNEAATFAAGAKIMSSRPQISCAAPTQFLPLQGGERYAYRRFGSGSGLPLLLLQHFTGTLDNWDPALTDALAGERELILFDNAGVGRSSGIVPTTVAGMAKHAAGFLDGLGVETCDVLGFSLGGMVAQQMVLDRPTVFRRLILVGTAPRGGEDIMHLEKPRLAKHLQDPSNKGYSVLQKIFFTLTPSGQAAGTAFVERLEERKQDLDGVSGPDVANAQMAAFRDWERVTGERFAEVRSIGHPTLVVNGVHDEMIPVVNSYRLVENLPNAVLLTYPDAGHGSLFQYHESFARQAGAFLSVANDSAVY
jgi:pimeloyl-ACP methyl ester carboxylesterase